MKGRMVGKGLRIYPETPEAYHAIRKYVETEKLEAFTYQLPEDREIKAVIRGMPADTPRRNNTRSPDEYDQQRHLQHDRTLLPEDQSGATSTQDRPCAVFSLPGIFPLVQILHEESEMRQVRSAPPHQELHEVVSNGGNLLLTSGNPEKKGTTRGSESPSRRSKSCNNLCPSLHPPTSESSPSKLYHSPPASTAPASIPTPPPVSAAPAPRPRPPPTPSTSQTSTQAINSTSSTSNPPSTIAETLKQLREPKVVEIFQVLKQVIAICNSDMPLADRAIEVAALLQIDLPI
ncbi:hypothetical protein TNCV_632331 [Trichonephila clavipes]|nr:hypothetical protein TNCV_632331 [Trichonephila clavipes]